MHRRYVKMKFAAFVVCQIYNCPGIFLRAIQTGRNGHVGREFSRERKKKLRARGCGINGIAEPQPRLWVKYFPASVFSFVYSTTQIFPLARFANAFLLRRFTEESGGHGWTDRLYPLDLSSWETAGGVTLCNYNETTKLHEFQLSAAL